MKKRKPTYLCFGIGKESFAVSALKVIEVLENQEITPVPNALSFLLGLISFRGNIIPVINIREKLNVKTEAKDNKEVIIIFDVILNQKKTIIAAIADEVKEVISADNEEIDEAPKIGLSFNPDFLLGTIKRDAFFHLLLDIDKVLGLTDKNIIL